MDDPNLEENQNEKAFEILYDAASVKKSTSLPPLPPCVLAFNPKGPYPCLICGCLFTSFPDAKEHSRFHNLKKNDQERENRTCSFCGKILASNVALLIHQVSEEIKPTCEDCLHTFHTIQEQENHKCERRRMDRKVEFENNICILGCGKAFGDEQKLNNHLINIHGYIPDTMSGEPENFDVCNLCGIGLNTDRIFILDHLFKDCDEKTALLEELLNSYLDAEKRTGISASTFLRLDIESYCSEGDCHECKGNDEQDSNCSEPRSCSFHNLSHEPSLNDKLEHWINYLTHDSHTHDLTEKYMVQNLQKIRENLKKTEESDHFETDLNIKGNHLKNLDNQVPHEQVQERLSEELGWGMSGDGVHSVLRKLRPFS